MIDENVIMPENTDFYKRSVLGINYTDIKEINDVIIFTHEDGNTFFVDKRRPNKRIKSELFKSISLDDKNPNIIYCDTENKTKIYLRNKEKFLASVPKSHLRFLSIDNDGNYYFAMSAKDSLNASLIQIINSKVNILTSPDYFITKVFEDAEKTFMLSLGNTSTVIKVADEIKTLYKDLPLARYYSEDKTITHQKGIISETIDGEKKSLNSLTMTIPLGHGLYKIISNDNVGLWYAPYGLVEKPLTKGYLLTFPNYYDMFKESGIFTYGMQDTNGFHIGKIIDNNKNVYVSHISDGANGNFLPGNLIVLYKDAKTILYNMYGIKKLTIPKEVRVEFIYPEGYREYAVYEIDGEYYKYNGKDLVKIRLKEKDMFIAGVKTPLGDIAINCYDEHKFLKICRYFNDKYNAKEIERVLLNLYNNNEEIKNTYPHLAREIERK